MFTRVARGFEELAELGLIERRPIRFVGGQAAGCAPVATALGGRDRRHRAGPRARHVRPLAGDRQSGRRPLRRRARARLRRLDRGHRGPRHGRGDPRRCPARGHLPGDRRRRDARAAAAARRRGVIRAGDEVVALLTGNGLKTPDARTLGARRRHRPSRRARPCAGHPAEPPARSKRGWRATHEHGPHPADASDRDRRGQAGRGRRGTVREVVDRPRRRAPASRPSCWRPTASSTASSTRSSTTPTSATSQSLDTPVGERDTLVLLPAMAGG